MTNPSIEPLDQEINRPLLLARIGDLHITQAKKQNHLDYLSIIAQLETECCPALDFVVLPGDNADKGLPDQYIRVATARKMLSVPVYIISGDHDMEQKSLTNDGHVIFSATRSTGQIEEGSVGYSLISVDNGIVGWRFKPHHDAFPFVLITSPTDYRLRRNE
ncbi:metallophosphoesterase family protein [Spirosoma telluris]|uniref:metallophosphoesterase family protein n=1 Tax=Spirosoma telluris TaxID=2183553 RepID=UPI0018DB5604